MSPLSIFVHAHLDQHPTITTEELTLLLAGGVTLYSLDPYKAIAADVLLRMVRGGVLEKISTDKFRRTK